MEYSYEDFYYSAKKAVEEHFNFFTYPARDSFCRSELQHIHEIATSILMTKYGFQEGGSFVQAVVADKMSSAYSRADTTMLKAMRIMSYVSSHAAMIKADPQFVPSEADI